jgi:hypothetical protein
MADNRFTQGTERGARLPATPMFVRVRSVLYRKKHATPNHVILSICCARLWKTTQNIEAS